MPDELLWWWESLVTVSLFNLVAWWHASLQLRKRQQYLPIHVLKTRRWQLWLSLAYVIGCGYRSFFPVFDVPRLCLVDSTLSSAFIGRSVATLAEICFAAQWALLAKEVAVNTRSSALGFIARLILPMILVAELCSWYSVLTQSNIGHVFEESVWAVSAAALSLTLLGTNNQQHMSINRWCLIAACAGLMYATYMAAIDVPMYWSRWLVDESLGRSYMGLEQGLWDASHRWQVSMHWSDWQSEIVWMSVYFSVGVWFSISFVHMPHQTSVPRLTLRIT